MTYLSKKVLGKFLFSLLFISLFTGCATVNNVIEEISSKSPTNHKDLTGANNFHTLVETLVERSYKRISAHVPKNDVILVSDFVNLDKLQNKSKLGFLLSDHLKDSLLNRNVIVRQVELGNDFQYGKQGFNVLTRNQADIRVKETDAGFAMVGTYSITTKSLIVFLKLIDIKTGNILSSANASTSIDDEILELEGSNSRNDAVFTPLVL